VPADVDGRTWEHGRVCTRRTPDAVLVLPLTANDCAPVALTGTAIDVWDAFARPTTIAEATSGLAAKFDGPSSAIGASVRDLVSELALIGALTWRA
jgi:hypothetical protein